MTEARRFASAWEARQCADRRSRALTIHFDILSALAVFAFVAAITPGPNNLMLMASGVKFGFARTLSHLVGVIIGFALMVALLGLGLNVVFRRFPAILPVMRVVGSLYMMWLALKIALAKPTRAVESGGRPIGSFTAAAFQWVNPKAWVMALGILSAYAGLTRRLCPQRAPDRHALCSDYGSLQRRLGAVRLLAAPIARQFARDAGVQSLNGGASGRIDCAGPFRVTRRSAVGRSLNRRASPSRPPENLARRREDELRRPSPPARASGREAGRTPPARSNRSGQVRTRSSAG